jgi:hypothetical protein
MESAFVSWPTSSGLAVFAICAAEPWAGACAVKATKNTITPAAAHAILIAFILDFIFPSRPRRRYVQAQASLQ